jgi:hypothetical protein
MAQGLVLRGTHSQPEMGCENQLPKGLRVMLIRALVRDFAQKRACIQPPPLRCCPCCAEVPAAPEEGLPAPDTKTPSPQKRELA